MLQAFVGANSTYAALFDRSGASDVGKLSLYRATALSIEGRFANSVAEAMQWVAANVPAGSPLLADSPMRAPIDVLTGAAYPVDPFAGLTSTDDVWAQLERGEPGPSGRVVLATPAALFMTGPRRYRVWYFVHEGDLLAAIRRSDAQYIVLGPRRLFFSLYLDEAPWATLQFRNADVVVYSIRKPDVAPVEHWTLVSADNTPDILRRHKEQFPEEFSRFEELIGRFELDEGDLVANTYALYQRRWIMEHIDPRAKIMYSNPLGDFAAPEWGENIGSFNTDRPFSAFAGQDHVFLHSMRRVSMEYTQLFSDLEQVKPFKVFPRLPGFDFGEGWEIYAAPAELE